jgi:AraC-like DNA-binding protein
MHDSSERLHKTLPIRLQCRLDAAGSYEAPQGKDFPPHWHRTWEVVYYREGAIECPTGRDVFPGLPGVVIATPPLMVHAERAITAYKNFYLQIDAPADHPWPRICYDDEHATLGGVCGALVREHVGQAPDRDEMIALLLDQLDLLLQRARVQPHLPEPERLVREAERLMQERSRGPLRIMDVAREVGVSPSFLRAQFLHLRGRTPRAYLQAVRIQHALSLIRNSNVPLEAVAAACGFDSASHLSRHVKRASGKSPGSLRERRDPRRLG